MYPYFQSPERFSIYISVSCVTRARSRFPFLLQLYGRLQSFVPLLLVRIPPLCKAAVDFFFIYSPFLTFHQACIYSFGLPIFDQPHVTNHSAEIIFARALPIPVKFLSLFFLSIRITANNQIRALSVILNTIWLYYIMTYHAKIVIN